MAMESNHNNDRLQHRLNCLQNIDIHALYYSYRSHVDTANWITLANNDLADFKVKAAVEAYTNILRSESEGHPIVLLNRSMAYLFLGFPHLAVTDAYRALIATDVDEHDPVCLRIVSQILSCAEETEDRCLINHESPILTSPLMSINLITGGRPVPLVDKPRGLAAIAREKHEALELVFQVRAMAYYRLCLALLKCGGGAVQAAVDKLCYALEETSYRKNIEEQLNHLLDVIIEEIESMKQCKSVTQKQFVENILRSRITRIPRQRYPWEDSKPRKDPHSNLNLLQNNIQREMKDVMLRPHDESKGGRELGLQAVSDITEGSILTWQSSTLFVTTQDVAKDRKATICDSCGAEMSRKDLATISKTRNHDTTPEHVSPRADSSGLPATASSNARLSQDVIDALTDQADTPDTVDTDTTSDAESLPNTTKKGKEPLTVEQEPLTPPLQPYDSSRQPYQISGPRSPPWSIPSDSDVETCPECQNTYYCSRACWISSQVDNSHAYPCRSFFHEDTQTLGYLYNTTIPHIPPVSKIDLQRRMLLKLISVDEQRNIDQIDWMRHGMGTDADPAPGIPELVKYGNFDFKPTPVVLLFPDIVWSDSSTDPTNADGNEKNNNNLAALTLNSDTVLGRPDENSPQHSNMIHWTFASNVGLPIRALQVMGGMDLALKITNSDGWMINTLIAKIDRGMRITRQPRHFKRYENDVVVEIGLKDKDRPISHEDVWVGSLHPITNLLQPSKSRAVEPNMTLVECGRTVYAVAGTNTEKILNNIREVSSTNSASDSVKDSVRSNDDGKTPDSINKSVAIPKDAILCAHPVVQYVLPPKNQFDRSFFSEIDNVSVAAETVENLFYEREGRQKSGSANAIVAVDAEGEADSGNLMDIDEQDEELYG